MAKKGKGEVILPLLLPIGPPSGVRPAGAHKGTQDEPRAKGKQRLARELRKGEYDEEGT